MFVVLVYVYLKALLIPDFFKFVNDLLLAGNSTVKQKNSIPLCIKRILQKVP